MALVLGTDYHYLAVSFNYLALIAHRLYRRSYFHKNTPFSRKNLVLGATVVATNFT